MKRLHDSTAKWRTAKEITGVSVSSIVDFKAAVAEEKEQIGTGKAKRARLMSEPERNKGVQLRAQQDQFLRVQEESSRSAEYAQQKLREKSEVYDKFVRGKDLDPNTLAEAYLVDFEQKMWDRRKEQKWEQQKQQPEADTVGYVDGEQQFYHEDLDRENKRRQWEKDAELAAEQEEEEREKRRIEREILSHVIEETQQGRLKAAQLQDQRKRKLELRKLQIQKKAVEQKERQEEIQQEQQQKDEEAEKLKIEENNRKQAAKLKIKPQI